MLTICESLSENIEPIKIYSTNKSPVNKLRAEFLRELSGTFLPLILPTVLHHFI